MGVIRSENADIEQDLQNQTPVLLRGFYGAGKTVITRQIADTFRKKGDITLNFDARIYKSLEPFYLRFGRQAIAELFNKEKEEKLKHGNLSALDQFHAFLERTKRKALVTIDEVVGLLPDFSKLRVIADLQRYEHFQIAVILHRIPRHEEQFAALFEGWKTHWIRSFTREEMGRFLRSKVEGKGISFSDDALEAIYWVSGGRSWEMERFCWHLHFENPDIAKFQGDDVRNYLEAFVNDFRTSQFIMSSVTGLPALFALISAREREILEYFAGASVPTANVLFSEAEIAPLVLSGIMERDGNGYRVRGELMRRMILAWQGEEFPEVKLK